MSVYRLKVSLRDGSVAVSGEVWRVIDIKGTQTLHTLHRAIFDAFGRWEHHLYSFYMLPNRRDKTQEYASPYFFEDDDEDEDVPRDASRIRIATLGLAVGDKFDYLFDYGDAWEHVVEVVGISDAPPAGRYPTIVDKQGPSPEQYAPYDESEDEKDDISEVGSGKVLPFPRKP